MQSSLLASSNVVLDNFMKRSNVKPPEVDLSVTSTELLRQAQANNQTAWQQLVTRYSRRIYRWCRRAGLQPTDAADVTQDVLHAVARKLGDFHRDRPGDTFRGWLRRITNNKVNEHFRKQNKTADKASGGFNQVEFLAAPQEAPGTWNTSLVASDISFVSSFKNQRIQTVIKNVRANISQRDWKLFWRIAVDGQSAAEAARELGITANAARLVKMRVLKRLKNGLADQPDS